MSDEVNPDPAEDRLVADLRRALPPDPVPAGLVARAEALYELRDLDHQLAALLEAPQAELAGARGPGADTARMSFQTGDGSVAVELVAGRRRLDGQVLAGAATEVVLESRAGEVAVAQVDELGRFSFSHAASGPGRLRLRGGPERESITSWFVL